MSDTRACFVRLKRLEKWQSAIFHGWGVETCETSSPNTIAVVELESSGRILTMPPEWVRFTNPY